MLIKKTVCQITWKFYLGSIYILCLRATQTIYSFEVFTCGTSGTEAALHRCSYKKVFRKYAANIQESIHDELLFQGCKTTLLNHTSRWVFSCKSAAYFQIFRTPFYENNYVVLFLDSCMMKVLYKNSKRLKFHHRCFPTSLSLQMLIFWYSPTIAINGPTLASPWKFQYFRGVFTTQSNIYDEAFCKNNWKPLPIFAKNLHYSCSTEFWIRLCFYKHSSTLSFL